jgi:hypothetical protein
MLPYMPHGRHSATSSDLIHIYIESNVRDTTNFTTKPLQTDIAS